MPIYEYQCGSCGEAKEAIQKFSDAPLTDCESCGEPELKKLLSAPAFRLKGGGWYETDFKGGKKKNLSSSDSQAPAASSSSSD
ncbi:FmdB family transcriptional regulator [Endozoicomonas sp. OPT23]|uniref:FmdB family zinc ribbon protein n=1 Tax=Endozoicomonas sp. OPT23 TaxID=2072845 RepID=UPI00129A2E27|nr:zinc ribbon domain-containing protein [Endozoicomonas sp. OPT23]MRI35326.1 FmdB family transcriptional regulator [Endozoicomonas sp. OPT23]